MKGMQKISRGAGFRGVLDYAQDRDSPEAERGQLIGGNMSGKDARSLALEFGLSRQLRPDIAKPVWHNALRLPAGERIDPEKFTQIADDYMERMGFSDQHQRCYWLHDDAEGQHIHIVASRVGLDGSVYLGKNENLKSTRHIAKLEEIYGLTITPGPEVDENGKVIMPDKRKLKKSEIERALRTGEEPPRQKLQRLLDEAMKGRPTVLQFAERMEAAGVVVIANMAKTTDKMNGFSFRIDGVPFSATQAGDKYKWSRLTKVIDYDEARDSAGLRQYTVAARADRNDQAATESDRAHAASAPDAAEPRRLSEPDRAVGTGVGDSNGRKQGSDNGGQQQGQQRSEATEGSDRPTGESDQDARVRIPPVARIKQGVSESQAPQPLASRFVFKPSDIGAYQRVLDLGGVAAGSASYRSKLNAWRRQHQALQAPLYRITLTSRRDGLRTYNLGKGKGEGGGERFYKAQEVADIIPTLSRQNARGYDVYVTPKDPDYHYLVVDDMTQGAVDRLKRSGFAPTLIQTSSEGNYQCVLKVPRDADMKDEQKLANQLVQYLNKNLGDPNFSGVVHPFRMAGFSNKKEGRKDFFTRILHAGHRVCGRAAQALEEMREAVRLAREKQRAVVKNRPEKPLERPCADVDDALGVLCVESYQSVLGHVKAAGWPLDMSRVDFRVAKILLSEGVPSSDVEALLLSYSEGLYERHSNPVDYVHRTVVNALIELEQAQRSSSIADYQETYCDNDVARSSIPRARF